MLTRSLRSARHRRRAQQGSTLIEVLVAILIASTGLLALAASHAASVRLVKLSQYRSIATQLATDIAERMRANNADADTAKRYAYAQKFANQNAAAAVAPANLCATAASICTGAEMAALDLYQWRSTVRAQLPKGSVFVLADGVASKALDVWVAWSDPQLAKPDEQILTNGARECPTQLDVNEEPNVRCLYFRVQL